MFSVIRAHRKNVMKIRDLYKYFANSEFHRFHLKYFTTFERKYHAKRFDGSKESMVGSRFHPLPPLEQAEAKLKEMLKVAFPRSEKEWNELKNELMDEYDIISELNFSNIVMNCLLNKNKYEEAHIFMDYLEKSNIAPNHLTYLKYMALCGRNVYECDQNITLKTFKKVKHIIEAAPVLDKTRAEHVILGICGTNQWHLALDYIKKYNGKPTMEMKNSIASAAIRNGREDFAWKVLSDWFRTDEVPSQWTFRAFIMYSIKLASIDVKQSERFIVKFFEYITSKYCVLDQGCVQLVEKYFKCHSPDWSFSYAKVNRNGECDSCSRQLELTDLSDKEFNLLKQSFLEKSLMRSDVFINTTKEEFDKYMRFIKDNKPFHVILDGLNVAYTAKTKNGFTLARQLHRVIKRLWDPSGKILILGKKHMLTWHKPMMAKMAKKAVFFLTNNRSQDDPFMIYAALESGPRSCIVSLDLMRDHASRLNDSKLINVFKRWQQSHQIILNVDDSNEINLVEPLKHTITIQGNMNTGWHIPYDDKIILDTYEELNNWLCITKKQR